ncbi:auxilin-related protein 1-like isoform X1 [Musa acuminata AAA Group]|uniref:auxilin-related protein 1-like isoform X1 n=2 Tax=Musa acuminata AAA Group TaxID=214697 RepID=UPI0031D27B8A
MDEFSGILDRDFGLRSQGKSTPIASPSTAATVGGGRGEGPNLWSVRDGSSDSTSSWENPSSGWNSASIGDPFLRDRGAGISKDYDYVFVGVPTNSSWSSRGQYASSSSPSNFDSIFNGFADSGTKSSSSLPVYDKPVYDDDIFDGVPGTKSSSSVKYDDAFASLSSGSNHVSAPPYEDLLENLGKQMPESRAGSDKRSGEKEEQDMSGFDELIPGFGRSSPPKKREDQEVSQQMSDISLDKPATSKSEDSFVILESVSNSKYSSSGLFSNPLKNISEPMNFGSMRVDTSPVSETIFDDVNAFDGISKSVPLSQQVQSTKSSDLQNTVGRNGIQNMDTYGKNTTVDQSPEFNQPIETRDDIWLTVSEIPLQTQPTSAPPPSRPPPPLVIKKAPLGAYTKRKENESFHDSTQSHPYNEKSAKPASVDELEDFAMGKPKTYTQVTQHHEDFFFNGEELQKQLAAEAAMKEAMHRAEARFKHAKEARGIDRGAKVSRNEEYIDEKKNLDGEDLEDTQRQEGSDHERTLKEREGKEEEKRLEKEREQEVDREREKARQAAARAIREARDRAGAEARLKAERAAAETRQRAERAAVQRAAAEARERAAAVAIERAEKAAVEAREKAAAEAKERERAAAEVREKAAAEAREKTAAEAREKAAAEARTAVERAAAEARLRAQRAAVERAAAEARERAAAAARERAATSAAAAVREHQKVENDLESFFSMGGARASSAHTSSETMFDVKDQNKGSSDGTRRTSSGSSSTIRKASSTTNIVGDLTSIFGGPPSSGKFQEVEGESEKRRAARLERHQRTQELAAKALAEKNERDMQIQREQAERHRIAEALDIEIKRWAAGKEGNLRALLSTLQYVLWPECGWQPVSLTDLITAAAVKKVYRRATLCVHPDKVQQKGATLQQKYIAEKVFDLLKEAWNKLNSEELF